MSERKVLVIGLDCVDRELIEAWISSGHLPFLAELWPKPGPNVLSSTAEVMHVSAWPSLHTGTTPGHHGMYHAYQVQAGNQNILRTKPEFCAQTPFWQYLDGAGKKCIVFDAFMDTGLDEFSGKQIREYGTWTWFGEPGSTPKNLLNRIRTEIGTYPAPEHSKVVTVPDATWFRNQLVQAAETKATAINFTLGLEPWDFAFVTFNEAHGASHYLWHLGDHDYPIFEETPNRHALRDIYQSIDRALSRVVNSQDDQTDIIIISCDGMGPNYSGCHLMPELLHKLDLFHSANVGQSKDTRVGGRQQRSRSGILNQVRQAIPLEWRQAITQKLPRDMRYRMSMKWANSGIDWNRTRIFCIPNNNEAYFRVNLRGREPLGNVNPGSESDQLLLDLKNELIEMVNPDTGERAARSVVLMDETFQGPERRHLPDLVVTWNNAAKTTNKIKTPTTGIVEREHSYEFAPHYMGNHRPNAFALVSGPSFGTSTSHVPASIVDIAPTVFDILGVNQPKHFEGRSWLCH